MQPQPTTTRSLPLRASQSKRKPALAASSLEAIELFSLNRACDVSKSEFTMELAPNMWHTSNTRRLQPWKAALPGEKRCSRGESKTPPDFVRLCGPGGLNAARTHQCRPGHLAHQNASLYLSKCCNGLTPRPMQFAKLPSKVAGLVFQIAYRPEAVPACSTPSQLALDVGSPAKHAASGRRRESCIRCFSATSTAVRVSLLPGMASSLVSSGLWSARNRKVEMSQAPQLVQQPPQ